jgi:Delta3-Delta2-enoyl-CoA isomerase
MIARILRSSSIWKVSGSLRHQSSAAATSAQNMFLVDINEKTGISTLTMNRAPVNCMSLEFLKEFCEKMDFLENEKVKGMILATVS